MSKSPVTSINVTYNVALITVDNLPNDILLISNIFNKIAEQNINIDLISQAPPYRGNINLSFTIPAEDIVKAISGLNTFKKDVPGMRIEVDSDNTKLAIYGEDMKNTPGIAARLFSALAKEGIEIKLVTTSEVDVSYLIFEKDVDRAILSIKREFGL